VDAGGTTSASCSARCGPRRRDWLGSDVALSKSAGYTTDGQEVVSSHDLVKSHGYNYLLYRMDALVQFPPRCVLRDKLLYLLEFIFTSSFESARVMKDETRVTSEHQFIINVVVAMLVGVKSLSRTYIDGGFHDIGIDQIVIDQ
jgi:hypothetical protein